MQIYGNVINGKLIYDHKKIEDYVELLGDCKISMKIEKVRTKRTTNQNALYWMWLQVISTETGYTTEELHNTFRAMFLTDRSLKLPLVRSTSVLNTAEFTQYMDKVSRQAAELGIQLPSNIEEF